MQGLGKIRVDFDLAGADGSAAGPTESCKKIVGGIAIGDLDRASTARQAGEFILGISDFADAIEEHLGPNAADGGFAEIAFVGSVGFVRTCAELVSAGVGDIADDFFEVVFVLLRQTILNFLFY